MAFPLGHMRHVLGGPAQPEGTLPPVPVCPDLNEQAARCLPGRPHPHLPAPMPVTPGIFLKLRSNVDRSQVFRPFPFLFPKPAGVRAFGTVVSCFLSLWVSS